MRAPIAVHETEADARPLTVRCAIIDRRFAALLGASIPAVSGAEAKPPAAHVLETGIKVVDVMTPVPMPAIMRATTQDGVGTMVLLDEMVHRLARRGGRAAYVPWSRLLVPGRVPPEHAAAARELRELLSDASASSGIRAQRAIEVRSQPFSVAEPWTARPGAFASIDAALAGYQAILQDAADTFDKDALRSRPICHRRASAIVLGDRGTTVDLDDTPRLPHEVLAYYARGQEDERLAQEAGKLERCRTEELLLRYLPAPPAVVLDVGGGTGRYAMWLAARGYTVHLVDPVPLHLDQARARSAAQPHAPLASISQGDARKLDWPAEEVDAVVLLGPLYHLTERGDRIRALNEAWRVLRSNGVVLAAAISRFASALDGLARHFFSDPRYAPITWQDLANGQHRGTEDAFFTTAYLHRPEELEGELTEAGFRQTRVLAIEGPAWLLQDFDRQWEDPMLREMLLEVVRRTEAEASLLGASSHLLAVGRKITDLSPISGGAV